MCFIYSGLQASPKGKLRYIKIGWARRPVSWNQSFGCGVPHGAELNEGQSSWHVQPASLTQKQWTSAVHRLYPYRLPETSKWPSARPNTRPRVAMMIIWKGHLQVLMVVNFSLTEECSLVSINHLKLSGISITTCIIFSAKCYSLLTVHLVTNCWK